MAEQPAKQLSNMGVLAVAAGVAGALGGLLAAFSRGSKPEPTTPVAKIQEKLEAGTNIVSFDREAAKQRTAETVDKARVQVERAIAEARSRAAQVDISGLSESASTNLKGIKQMGAGLATVVGTEVVNRASEALTQAQDAKVPERAKAATANVGGDAKTLGATIGEALRKNAGPIMRDALSSAGDSVEAGKKTAKKAKEKATEQVIPTVADLSGRVAEQASHAKEVVIEQAPHLKEIVGEQASHVKETVAQQATHLTGVVAENAHVIGENLSHRTEGAAERLSTAGSAVDSYSRQAAVSAGKGAKNTSSALFWGTAAAGVAYLAFLNPEQREKVKAAAGRIFQEGRTIYQDIRGFDGEF